MHRLSVLGFSVLLSSACAGKEPSSTSATDGSTTNTTTTSTTSTTTATSTTSETPPTGDGTAAASEGTSETAGVDCAPTGLDACPVTQCIERWEFECPGCGLEVNPVTCFEIDVGCAYPLQNCPLDMPCDRVWGTGYDAIEAFESEAAALCMLTALRDGTAGRFEVLWGEMGDEGINYMQVYSGGKDTVLIEWAVDCQGCPESGAVGRSGQLTLQPDSYFDDCLAAPNTASLIQCVFGFVDFAAGQPPPDAYAPPFTTGECASLELSCPT